MNTIKSIQKAPLTENLADIGKGAIYILVTILIIVYKIAWFISKNVLVAITWLIGKIYKALESLKMRVL